VYGSLKDNPGADPIQHDRVYCVYRYGLFVPHRYVPNAWL
jgi:hypothetical protein